MIKKLRKVVGGPIFFYDRLADNIIFVNQISKNEIQLTPLEIIGVSTTPRFLFTTEIGKIEKYRYFNDKGEEVIEPAQIVAHVTMIIEETPKNIKK